VNRLIVAIPPGGLPEGFTDAVMARAKRSGAQLMALYVIDEVWSRYSGADWLSTGHSRSEFDGYMKATLRAEGERLINTLSGAAEREGVAFSSEILEGPPGEAVTNAARSIDTDEVVTAPDFPELETVKKKSHCPVILYPWT